MSNVASAVQFLRDPNVQHAPLQVRSLSLSLTLTDIWLEQQKIQFLESKGLNKQEIDQALQQSSSAGPLLYSPHAPPYDWRDWFIMTVVGGGLAWLSVALARVSPSLPPS
jgi:peroxin-14